jgi:hypothetical protein
LLDGLKSSACGKLSTGMTETTESPNTFFTPGDDAMIISTMNKHMRRDDSMLKASRGCMDEYIKISCTTYTHSKIGTQTRKELHIYCIVSEIVLIVINQ